MCQSGTRIGRTKAIDSALKASKKVALPMTIRARANHRDVGTCSIRAISWLAAASASKADEDNEAAAVSEHGVALASDTSFSRLTRSASPAPESFQRSIRGTRSASDDERSAKLKASNAATPCESAPTS